MTHRVFFAALPDDATSDALSAAIAPLQAQGDQRLRWLERENWHVTLRFVGDVAEPVVAALRASLDDMTGHAAFQQTFTAVEVFPDERRPIVLAATGPDSDAALAIVEDLEDRCRSLGLPAEKRPWRPHLTLARVRGRRRLPFPPIQIQAAFTVRQLVMMESVAAERGRRYTPVAGCALRTRPSSRNRPCRGPRNRDS